MSHEDRPESKNGKEIFEDLTYYAMGEELNERDFGEDVADIRDGILSRARKSLNTTIGKIAGVLDRVTMQVRSEWDGPEYLAPESEEYQFVYNYIREMFGNPESDEVLEGRLAAYANQLREHPNAENFAQRMPAIVYGQRPRNILGTEESMFLGDGDQKKKQLILGVTPVQSATLRTYVVKKPKSE